jgi:glycosyltransferase involved in cell wall biosynthesis
MNDIIINKLTIIVLTYNRPFLLEKALNSLQNQIDKNFDVIIYNNASTDNTVEVIQKYLTINPKWILVNGENNSSIMKSVRRYSALIKTPSATFLCDDDMLDPNYSMTANKFLINNINKLICFNIKNIDINGEFISKTSNIEKIYCKNEIAHIWRTDHFPSTAGITGFIFPSIVLINSNWDYPNSFFVDTRLVLEASLLEGVVSISSFLIKRLEWEGALSQQSFHRIIQRLKAHIEFLSDIKIHNNKLVRNEYWMLHNPIKFFRNYFRNFIQLKSISFNEISSIYTETIKSDIIIKFYVIICIFLLILVKPIKTIIG